MTDKQYEIGDKLLSLFMENDGFIATPIYMDKLKAIYGDNKIINTTVIMMIEDYKLIRRGNSESSIKIITAEGQKAFNIGLRQYINNFDNEQKLEIDLAKSNIKANKQNTRFSRINLCFTVINIIITIIALCVAIYAAKHQ